MGSAATLLREDGVMGAALGDTRTIVSIYYLVLEHTLPLGHKRRGSQIIPGGFTQYILPASKRGEHKTCLVKSDFQFIREGPEGLDENKPNPGVMPVYCSSTDIAKSLVNTWTLHRSGSGKPGVAVLPVGETQPSEDLLESLFQNQLLYAQSQIDAANDLKTNGRARDIGVDHRGAAFWAMGDAAKKLPWIEQHRMSMPTTKTCPNCRSEIDAQTLFCLQCKVDLVEFYQKRGTDPVNDDVVLAEINLRREVKARNRPPLSPAQQAREAVAANPRWQKQPATANEQENGQKE